MILWALYLVIVVYNALDVWQTHLLLSVGAVELNPIYNFLADYVGMISGIILVKVFFLTILGILLTNFKLIKREN